MPRLTINSQTLPSRINLWRRRLSEDVLYMKSPVEFCLAMSNLHVSKKWRCKFVSDLPLSNCSSLGSNRKPMALHLHHCEVCAAHLDSKSNDEPTWTPATNIATAVIAPMMAMRRVSIVRGRVDSGLDVYVSSIDDISSSDSFGTKGRDSSGSFSIMLMLDNRAIELSFRTKKLEQ
jgi:hypothetical protein